MLSKLKILSLALSGIISLSSTMSAHDLTKTNNKVSENFDSMWDGSAPTTKMPEGWKVEANKTAVRNVGNWDNAASEVMYTGGPELPSNAKNGTWNFGMNNSSDRAVGGFTTTVADGTRGVNIMTKLSNNDESDIITNLILDYNIEKYRTCANDAGFDVSIWTSKDGKIWTVAEQLTTHFPKETSTADGAVNVPISTTAVKGQNLRVHVEPSQDIYVAWNISVATGSSPDKAPGLSVDDINITATFSATDDDWEEDDYEFNPSGIYLRGEVNGWSAESGWEFSKLSDTQYEIRNKILSGAFKIADASWSSSCNYGSNGSNILMDEVYELVSGTDSNISTGNNSFPCSRIVLTIENGKASLLLEPNVNSEGLTTVYMIGDFNNWNYMGTQGALKLDTSDNLFKGQVSLTAGSNGLSEWVIYQRLAMAGVWGLTSDAKVASTSGNLVKGQKGHAVAEPATYEVSFNLSTGEYVLTKKSSTISSMELNPSETVLVPQIPEEVKLLSLNNSLIHYNDQARMFNEIAASQGKKASWTKHTNLGKTLDYHWNEGDGMTDAGIPGAKMTIRSDAWTHIILQEQTALPRTDLETFRASVKKWVEYIRNNCPNPNAVIILPMNWHYAQDWSNFEEFNDLMVKNYTDVATELGVVVCPVAVAYGNKYATDGGAKTESEWFLPGDDRHPTIRSTYMAALMEYGLIFNEDPSSVSYYPQYTTDYDSKAINAEIAAEMRNYASQALKQYENTVNHHNGTINFNLRLLDNFGMSVPVEKVDWSVEPAGASIVDGIFKAEGNGEYTVTATTAGFTKTANVKVVDAVTEMIVLPCIEINDDKTEYTQDFNGIGDSAEAQLPEGWRIDRTDSPRAIGTFRNASETTTYSGGINLASNAKNGVYNFGSSTDNTDRAVGGITTGVDGGTRAVNVYAHIKNNGTRKITDLDIKYNVEKYRDGANAAGYTVKLYKSEDGINWSEAGNDFITIFPKSSATAGAEIVPIETKSVEGNISQTIVSGAELYLAWNISVSSGTDCSGAPALAIDDVIINSNLEEIPVYDYYIYIANETDYEYVGLYAWGDKEMFGSWPGQTPFDKKTITHTPSGITYTFDVFGHNEETGNYNLIYNNNNQGSQLSDFNAKGGRDYYFRATSSGLIELNAEDMSSVETLTENNSSLSFFYDKNSIKCENASNIAIYSISGYCVASAAGEILIVENLPKGFYIAIGQNGKEKKALNFVK